MAREPFKTTIFGIIVLGVISSWIANQVGFISLSRLFGSAPQEHETTRIVQIVDGRKTPTPTPKPPNTFARENSTLQTSQPQPMVGTPTDVPVPSKTSFPRISRDS